MEDRNRPVDRSCPHCGVPGAKLMPTLGDYDEYQCPKCGTYHITGSDRQRIENGEADPKHGRFDNRNGRRFLVPYGRPRP